MLPGLNRLYSSSTVYACVCGVKQFYTMRYMQILLYTNLGKSLLDKQSALLVLHVHMCLTSHTCPNTTLCTLMNIAQQPWWNDDLSMHQAFPFKLH